VSLLTASDRDLIDKLGVPTFDRDDLWLRTSDDAVVLTVKGLAFLRETACIHGVACDLGELASYKALRMFCWRVTQAVLRREQAAAARRLQSGLVAPADRCVEAAGPNVIPVAFGRRAR